LTQIRDLLAKGHNAALSPAQRLAAQFEELDAALLRFSTGANRRVGDAVGFDALRWFDAVRVTLQVPIETPEYPGRKFMVQCADLANAVAGVHSRLSIVGGRAEVCAPCVIARPLRFRQRLGASAGRFFLSPFHRPTETERFGSCLDDVSPVSHPIQQSFAQARVRKDRRPLRER